MFESGISYSGTDNTDKTSKEPCGPTGARLDTHFSCIKNKMVIQNGNKLYTGIEHITEAFITLV